MILLCSRTSEVYTDLIISTIVDARRKSGPKPVYTDLIISTIVDFCYYFRILQKSIRT